jgi:hypothetical protein
VGLGKVGPLTVPSEYIGQARLFREAVLDADRRVEAALPVLTAPLRSRLTRKPTLRSEHVAGAARAWDLSVSDGLTLTVLAKYRKRSLTIAELRPTGSRWLTDSWCAADWQLGISLVWVAVSVENGRFRFTTRPAGHMLLHALARRFERGDGRSVEHIVRDLRALAAGLNSDLIEIPAVGGRWVGERHTVRDEDQGRNVTMFHCKTFLN